MTLEDKLSGALYRIDCPDSVELGEFHFETLDSERTNWINSHVAICPHCTGELAQLRVYLNDVKGDLDYSLADRVRIVIARLIPTGAEQVGGMQPAFAVRGREVAPLMYEADDLQISIEVAAEEGQPTPRSLVGLVVGDDMNNAPVSLWPSGEAAAEPSVSTEVDDIGSFVLPDVSPGTYDLVLRGEGKEIHVLSLEIA